MPGPESSDGERRTLRRGVANGAWLGLLALAAIVVLNRDDVAGVGVVMVTLPLAMVVSAAVHVPQIVLTALAWRALVTVRPRPGRWAMTVLRWYREAANALLPAGALLGQTAAARLLSRRGVPGSLAGATATVDLTVEAVSQLIVTLVGLALLLAGGRGGGMGAFALASVAVALAAAVLGAVAMVAVQRRLPARRLEALLARAARRWPAVRPSWVGEFQGALLRLHDERRALIKAMLLHSAAWLLGGVEIAGVLALLGHGVSLTDALIIEILAQALRNVGFMLPGAVGVQEGALVAVAGLVGVPATPALTTALVRRTREVLFGLPGLIAWRRSERAVARCAEAMETGS